MAGNVNLRSIGEMPKNYMLNQESKLASKDGFPLDIVRLNSAVQIKPDGKDEIFEVRRPDKADIKENKVSIMVRIAAALIRFRQGQKVKWQVPAVKNFHYHRSG
jgi:regulator of nucleoside diphosphate kinase